MNSWKIEIPKWYPNLNRSRGRHWRASYRATQEAKEFLTVYAQMAGVKLVTKTYRPFRQVAVTLAKSGAKPDPDNLMKNLLDGMKGARLIVDDSAEWCIWTTPKIRGIDGNEKDSLSILIEDVPKQSFALRSADPEFTRAVVETRPVSSQITGSLYPVHDFRIYFKHPDRSAGEQLWLCYPAVDPLHLERLTKWCESLGVKIEREPAAPVEPKTAPRAKNTKTHKRAEFF